MPPASSTGRSRAGHGYLYVVRAVDANGRVIAQSDGVSVQFPPTMTTNAGAAA